jgi:hypothetical protein
LDEFISTSSSAEGSDVSREMSVGRALPGFAVDVERDPLRLFARAIGDRRTGQRAGHPVGGRPVIELDDLAVGAELTPLLSPPVTRTTLALFAGASGELADCRVTPARHRDLLHRPERP